MLKGEPLRLERLCKQYGSIRAVREVSVQIEAGEFVSFLGPSGSGKTTTLMMIAGFATPTAGQIFIGARPVTGLPNPQFTLSRKKRNLKMPVQTGTPAARTGGGPPVGPVPSE
ncbi:ATP-binding cassette domain-containing protein [Bradyrhizobium erythrophlei]|uniref:ATP-binding cassette domain-containing protein n=1 Tax=Bradyrhizobium erythrophlei TaxID=1437360 RepID=UPI0035EF5155